MVTAPHTGCAHSQHLRDTWGVRSIAMSRKVSTPRREAGIFTSKFQTRSSWKHGATLRTRSKPDLNRSSRFTRCRSGHRPTLTPSFWERAVIQRATDRVIQEHEQGEPIPRFVPWLPSTDNSRPVRERLRETHKLQATANICRK